MGGADAVLNAGSHHHTYSYDVKLAVVKDRLENGLTVREAMIKHKIPSESSVKAWCRQYREAVRPHWSISRAVASRALKGGIANGMVRPQERIFLAAPTFGPPQPIGHPPKWPINRAQWPVRPPLR
ncbi:MAG: helix-turn-helix domain-containing protein [Collinsella sp.]